jgi:hypothetical protein
MEIHWQSLARPRQTSAAISSQDGLIATIEWIAAADL